MNTISWLQKLVSYDTTSRNSNLELIAVIENWLTTYGMTTHLIHDPKEDKANLFATLPASNGDQAGGIILSGHTDVVPIDGQDWETEPFVATEVDGKIFGRGTADMKGFIAVVLALLPEFQKMKLTKPIHFAFSYDEEIGCRGAPHMITAIKKLGLTPSACIVGEPTNMRPVIAHKGIQVFRCKVHGHAAHSSLTSEGCNAIEYAAELICYLRQLAEQQKVNGPHDPYYDVTYTTLTTNLMKGGNAYNTIPALAEFIFEFRNLPEENPAVITEKINHYVQNNLLPRMKKENANANIEIEAIATVPGFISDINAEINRLARKLTNETETLKVAYATEAGLFQLANIPSIICGPGSITDAHRANEFVTLSQLQKCEAFLRKVVQ